MPSWVRGWTRMDECKVRVVCINNEHFDEEITKGKVYTAYKDLDSHWVICDNWGDPFQVDKVRFVEFVE